MKRLLVLFLLLLPIILCLAQAKKPVTVIEFNHPPFVYQDTQTNAIKGAEIAYLTAVLNDLGYQPTFTTVPFPRMLTMLQSGEADIGPFLTKTADREAFALYSSKSILTMNPVLVVLKDSPLKQLKTPSDLKGFKIGFSTGQTVPVFFDNSGLPPFDLSSGDNLSEQNLSKLISKRYDACIELNPYTLSLTSKSMKITDSIRTIEIPKSGTMFYVLLSKKSKIAADILPGINASINAKKYNFEKFLQDELK